MMDYLSLTLEPHGQNCLSALSIFTDCPRGEEMLDMRQSKMATSKRLQASKCKSMVEVPMTTPSFHILSPKVARSHVSLWLLLVPRQECCLRALDSVSGMQTVFWGNDCCLQRELPARLQTQKGEVDRDIACRTLPNSGNDVTYLFAAG